VTEPTTSFTLSFGDEATRRVDAIYATPDVVAQRQATLETIDLKPGERVADLGVGPGYLAASMASIVGERGRVRGIDVSESMLAIARDRCNEFGWVDVQLGDVTALPFAAGDFDLAISTQVLEYVPEVDKALGEMRRILRPGGRAAIVDTDWDSIVWASQDPDLMASVLKTWDQHLIDPHLPLKLSSRLREAGFRVERVEIIPILNREFCDTTYSFGMAELIADFVTGRDGLSAADTDRWLAGHRALDATGDYFFSVNRYLFIAEAL
jgi:SAM-dependent methyltransferase